MEKRLLTAVLLSVVILFGWQFVMSQFFPPPPPSPPKVSEGVPAPIDPSTPPAAEAPRQVAEAPASSEPERTVVVETSRWVARFSNRGGVPTSWVLLVGPDDKPILAADHTPLELIPQVGTDKIGYPFALTAGTDTARFNGTTYRMEIAGAASGDTIQIADGQSAELSFVGVDPVSGQELSKTFTFTGGLYDVGITVNAPDQLRALPLGVLVGPRIGDQGIKVEGGYNTAPPHALVADNAGEVQSFAGSDFEEGQSKAVEGTARWAAVADNYFAMALARSGADPAQAVASSAKISYEPPAGGTHDFPWVVVPVGGNGQLYGFVGPKDHGLLSKISERATTSLGTRVDFDGVINYGMFAFLVRPLIAPIDWSLQATNRITHNYGLSIIIVTALVNLLFFPLRYKSTVSIRRAAKLQPRMKELQAKMKKLKMDDPEYKRLQQEQMDLMRQGNPLGGCLPLLLQLPIFWAFFNYFTMSFVVRQQPFFLWVNDLSSHDPYYVLPVVMCAAQIGATMLTPMPNNDDPALKMQRTLMTWVMPVVFAVFFFASAPSGLMLYWLTTNVAGIGIQLAINKMLPPEGQDQDGAGVESGTAGAPPKGKKKGAGAEARPEVAGSV